MVGERGREAIGLERPLDGIETMLIGHQDSRMDELTPDRDVGRYSGNTQTSTRIACSSCSLCTL
jgi:hypothetical protein